MFDIEFFMRIHELKKRLLKGEKFDKEDIFNELEENRSQDPIIYNIETTNACNMRCKMCPRTTMMTRPIGNIDQETFIRVIEQIKPFPVDLWNKWEIFVEKNYQIPRGGMSENHFFLFIIPKVIQLHGYGDPLLDKHMAEYVKLLSDKGFYSYFSCNPANINIDRTVQMFENGLDYIKYSIETVDDMLHKQIRGQASNFTESYKNILRLLEIKKERKHKVTIIITMLDLNLKTQKEEYGKLKEAFKGLDVYIYLKSEDTQWYREDYHGTKSVHWTEYCQHPWMSITVKSNGEVAMCMEDFNNEIVLGNAKEQSLYDIWNGEKYRRFRKDHFDLTRGIKCTEQCDMKLIGELINR